jgi:hypothetical protein
MMERKEDGFMERKPLRQHPFDIMVMGRREDNQTEESKEVMHEEYKEDAIDKDNGNLMSNIEILMGAVSELRPLVNKIMPFITKWTK